METTIKRENFKNVTDSKGGITMRFENLRKMVEMENEKFKENVINNINEATELTWKIKEYITPLRIQHFNNGKISLNDIKKIALKKIEREYTKRLETELRKIESVENAPEFDGCTISIEWKRNRIWGLNPKATLYGSNRINGKSIGGCGYDRKSTAFADVANQELSLLKFLYKTKEREIENSNMEITNEKLSSNKLLGYGAGYGTKPYFEGGVGVECYYSILEKCGLKMKQVVNDKYYDVFEISKI